ncbi:MAG: DNRLRE domain-containing protein [Verrucomicrobiota bacterium]
MRIYTTLLPMLAALTLCISTYVSAVPSPYNGSHRIAISTDGNPDADPDDIGATPMTLAILAKAGLQGSLVHYDFNNWLEYKRIDPSNNKMWVGALGGQSRWGFDRSKFFDAAIDPQGAIANLTVEINKSTANNPLYIVVGGPMELIYQAMKDANNSARAHVALVSHSGYNDYYKPRMWQNNLDEVRALNSGIRYFKIPDQNGTLRTQPDYSPWFWLRDHPDANLRWVYSRMQAGLADVSDSGMVTWLLGISGNNDTTSMTELRNFFGNGQIPTNGGGTNAPAPPPGVDPVINLPVTESIFQEVGGRIVIEAESVPLDGDWVVETSESGFTGSGYIRYVPSFINAIDSLAKSVLIYKLRITEPGNYRMALKASHRGAPERDKWNDCWTLVGIDPAPFGNIRKTYHSISQQLFDNGVGFTFNTTHDNRGVIRQREGHFSQPLYSLSAGDHYFFIVGRSGGYRLDKIHFFKEGVSGFKNDSIASTPIISGGTNTVNCSQAPSSVPSINSVDVDVPYTAAASRDIVAEFWGPSGWLGQTRQTVSAGNGTASLSIPLNGGAPTPGNGYFFKISNRPVGGVWNAPTVVRCETGSVTVNSAFENVVDCSPIAGSFISAATINVDVAYEAAASRDIVAEFWGPSGWLGQARQTVGEGTGTVTLTIPLGGGAPAPGTGYLVKASNRPVGGVWNAPTVVRCENNNVTVTNGGIPANNSVDCSPLPTAIEAAASFDVQVNYEATESRDIVFEFWGPSGWLASTNVTVNAGSGTATATLTPIGGVPATGTYLFKASNRPVGGAWNAPTVVRCQDQNVAMTPGPNSTPIMTTETPVEDAYIESSTTFNDNNLKAEPNRRVSYLKFDVDGVGNTVTGSKLVVQLTEAGSGTVRVYQGNSNPGWTESTLNTGNAPGQGTQLGSATGSFANGSVLEIDLGTTIGNGQITLVITMDGGGNDIWFSSSEGANAPRLEIDSL